MIVVFVVDTSPSMGRASVGGLSRLDVAKIAVEDFLRQWRRLRAATFPQAGAIGQHAASAADQFLLLSTSRQYPDTAACAAGGRLLVGFGNELQQQRASNQNQQRLDDPMRKHLQPQSAEVFQRELKLLKVATIADPTKPWPEEAGGAVGLNAALSAGLELLSRFRLQHRQTENFGMGRLPNSALLTTSNAGSESAALQPACLVLLTDGACLRHAPQQGGGALQLHYGSQPLREFYQEPFRWDQRIFVQAIGASEGMTSTQYLHSQLRTLCEVTGGAHWALRGSKSMQNATEDLLKRISPPLPRELPLADPLYLKLGSPPGCSIVTPIVPGAGAHFVNGGPVCCFQCLESEDGIAPATMRAMLLYVSSTATATSTATTHESTVLCPPLFCIPESFFPNKQLDTLPPRPAQPRLLYSKYPANLGSKSFDAMHVIKLLHKLDQLSALNQKAAGQQRVKLLQRDVYICEWLDPEGGKSVSVPVSSRLEYFPVFMLGAGRPSLSDSCDNYLNIGILHVPAQCSTLAQHAHSNRLATLTLLPPEPHILLPLLVKAAEAEHRAIKKAEVAKPTTGSSSSVLSMIQKNSTPKVMVHIDEQWKSEFRAYLFRLPPYYHDVLKRCLRPILPTVVHSILHIDGTEIVAMQCFSKLCHQKIRNGEQVAKDINERLERQEAILRWCNTTIETKRDEDQVPIGYGQYDSRTTTDSYLAALRSMPPPWQVPGAETRAKDDTKGEGNKKRSVADILGDLPASCLMAYYESRRRWIFGGPGLTIRGLHVDGTRNDGSNSQRHGSTFSEREECPLSIAGVGVSTLNQTTTTKMGEYKERLVFSRSPVVGYGSNDAAGVSATTSIDGSPSWSVDDDAMPMTFFDPKTGEFADSVEARIRSKLMVNFGNPYKEKRADSMIPENFLSQTPSVQKGGFGSLVGSPRTPPGSPPHDSFDSVEEGEAIFVRQSPAKKSPTRDERPPIHHSGLKRLRSDSDDSADSSSSSKTADGKPRAPPVPPPLHKQANTNDVQVTKSGSPKQPPLPPRPKGAPPPPGPPKAPPRPPKPSSTRSPAPKDFPPPKPPSMATTTALALAVPVMVGLDDCSTTTDLNTLSTKVAPVGHSMEVETQLQPSASDSALSDDSQAPETMLKREDSESSFRSLPTERTINMPPPRKKLNPMIDDASESLSVSPPTESKLKVKSATELPPLVLDLESPDVKPDVALPPGWICVWSKSQKRWYFFDTKTNKSVWTWPP